MISAKPLLSNVQVGDPYYYKVTTVMMDDTPSEMSEFALGELEEITQPTDAEADLLPWILVIVFLVLWIVTLLAFMLGRKKEPTPTVAPVQEPEPEVMQEPVMEQPVEEETYAVATIEEVTQEQYVEPEPEEEMLDEMDG